VLEHLQGGELLEYLHHIHHFSEQQAAMLFRQVGLAFLAQIWLAGHSSKSSPGDSTRSAGEAAPHYMLHTGG
jgi:hypothetical protein